MERKHQNEIIRWANTPEGTKVWFKDQNDTKWGKMKYPSWVPKTKYVVDDEWAEIRKKFIDDPDTILEVLYSDGKWREIDNFTKQEIKKGKTSNLTIDYYRIKPKKNKELK